MLEIEDTVESEQKETIHIYVVREGDENNRLPIIPLVLSILALLFLIALCSVIPYQQPEMRIAVRVPAVPLPTRTLTSRVPVIPTGIKTYPATSAIGELTITNGSVLTVTLPKGMIYVGRDGEQVATDYAVTVPAGTATSEGVAYVSAHVVIAGATGNIPVLDINAIEGTSMFIRNTQAFYGGRDGYSVKVETKQDRFDATTVARQSLSRQVQSLLLASPCNEVVTERRAIIQVTWTCEPVTFDKPHLHDIRVLHAQALGRFVMLDINYSPLPRPFPGK